MTKMIRLDDWTVLNYYTNPRARWYVVARGGYPWHPTQDRIPTGLWPEGLSATEAFLLELLLQQWEQNEPDPWSCNSLRLHGTFCSWLTWHKVKYFPPYEEFAAEMSRYLSLDGDTWFLGYGRSAYVEISAKMGQKEGRGKREIVSKSLLGPNWLTSVIRGLSM